MLNSRNKEDLKELLLSTKQKVRSKRSSIWNRFKLRNRRDPDYDDFVAYDSENDPRLMSKRNEETKPWFKKPSKQNQPPNLDLETGLYKDQRRYKKSDDYSKEQDYGSPSDSFDDTTELADHTPDSEDLDIEL